MIYDEDYFIIISSSEKVDIYGYETATLASAGFAVSFFYAVLNFKSLKQRFFVPDCISESDLQQFHL